MCIRDSLNRPTAATSPDGSVYRATFNAANGLETPLGRARPAADGTYAVEYAVVQLRDLNYVVGPGPDTVSYTHLDVYKRQAGR